VARYGYVIQPYGPAAPERLGSRWCDDL